MKIEKTTIKIAYGHSGKSLEIEGYKLGILTLHHTQRGNGNTEKWSVSNTFGLSTGIHDLSFKEGVKALHFLSEIAEKTIDENTGYLKEGINSYSPLYRELKEKIEKVKEQRDKEKTIKDIQDQIKYLERRIIEIK